jgi:ADP-ribose pyrophosphatase YjhB (NUDIX family)
MIRITAKAVIISDDRILLIQCNDPFWGQFYDLPGGGRRCFETAEETVSREVLEETGYSVTVKRWLGVYEEIYMGELRERYRKLAHQLYQISECVLDHSARLCSTAVPDKAQMDMMWMPLNVIAKINLCPRPVRDNFLQLLGGEIFFIGTGYLSGDIEHVFRDGRHCSCIGTR